MTDSSTDRSLFSQIPEEVLYSNVSDGAYRLYGALARVVNQNSRQGYIRIKELAERLGKSDRSIKRHVQELKNAKLIRVQKQWTDDNGNYSTTEHAGWRPTVNLYTLPMHLSGGDKTVTTGGEDNNTGGGDTDGLLNESHTIPQSYNTSFGGDSHNQHSTSDPSESDERHFTSNSQANNSHEDHLPKEVFIYLRSQLQNVGRMISEGHSFFEPPVQDLWGDFEALLEEATEDLPYGDLVVDLTQNGKWTISAKVADEYEAGKELITLLNTARSS